MKRYLFLTVTLVLFFSLAVNAFAATYYVATTGNNRNPGTESSPCATLAYAESRLSSGDTVIVRGGTYQNGCTIDVNNVTFQNYPSETPIIDGDEIRPGGDWDSLIKIMANGVTINGFEIRESTGRGIFIENADNAIIKNCTIHEIYRMCFHLKYADDALIEDCDFHHGAKRKLSYPTGVNPSTVSVRYSAGATFRRCKIHDSYHEGFNLDNGSSDALVEYCEIYGNPKLNLYLVCAKNHTIRYNLIYGTNNGKGPGIWLSSEPTNCNVSFDGYHKIYGNLVANTTINLWIAGAAGREVKSCVIYNNTFVESTCGLPSGAALQVNNGTGGGHIFKNNIIWQTDNTIASVPSGKMTCDYNLWSKEPDNDDIKGAHDPTYTVPQLAKTSGWNNLKGEGLKLSDFALEPTSPVIDKGSTLSAEFDDTLDCDKSVWPAQVVLKDQAKQGSGWEIGADIHVANPTALDPPTNLKVAAGQ